MIRCNTTFRDLVNFPILVVIFLLSTGLAAAQNPVAPQKVQAPISPQTPQCKRTINADVVALAQPIMLNRLGAAVPGGQILALKADTVMTDNRVQLRDGKRPRPLVLRANVGDCLKISFTNSISSNRAIATPVPLHVQGLEWNKGSDDDRSSAGARPGGANTQGTNPPRTQTYTVYAKEEGTFLVYAGANTKSDQLARGLFGAINVQPEGAEWYRSQVTADDLDQATYSANNVPAGSLVCSPPGSSNCTFTANGKSIKVIKAAGGYLQTLDNHPLINYDAKYTDGTLILKMLDANNNIVHSDLTAIITGSNAGRFPGASGNPNKPEPPCNGENWGALRPPPGGRVDPLFCANPASPDRKEPYREITIIYHDVGAVASQAFPVFGADQLNNLSETISSGSDRFAINYGSDGIASEVYANRIGIGPSGNCVDCKFEEFFLSAWAVGDPAMIVDKPADSNDLAREAGFKAPCNTTSSFNQPPCGGTRVPGANGTYTMQATAKATAALFPDDPSNVYHSYINDHVKFRILNAGQVNHVHHQHAHQWLRLAGNDESDYLDAQTMSPGDAYTLEMVYNGSNRNKVVGDSIFHCDDYAHLAAGMWATWRTHDVFESGTFVYPQGTVINGRDVSGQVVPGSRALSDGEIKTGTPIPAIVPLPTIPMAPLPGAQAEIVNGQIKITGNGNPGFPFFIPGQAGARAPHPPLGFAPDGAGGLMDGGLPRHVVVGGSISYERHNKLDWSKDLATLNAVGLPEDGTDIEKAVMAFFGKRCYPTFFPDGTPGSCPSSNSTPPQSTINTPPTGFVLNGLPLRPQPGAPFADPAIDDNGSEVNFDWRTKKQEPNPRTYKAASIQLDLVSNQKAKHFPQQRMLSLWEDVGPTLAYKPGGAGGRKPEPLFFRGNSGDIIEYWHTNLAPNYYLLDDFQVRHPTPIEGQHIHLVKFDVTSSDGGANGFNYEDGALSPPEVQEVIRAINATGGLLVSGSQDTLSPKPPPKQILDCANNAGDPRCTPCPDELTLTSRPQCQSWLGAQTTIQRWYLDPRMDNSGVDKTLRPVLVLQRATGSDYHVLMDDSGLDTTLPGSRSDQAFASSHALGPGTLQQGGSYDGLLVEPTYSTWRFSDGTIMGAQADRRSARDDGGPTSSQAVILTKHGDNKDLTIQELAVEFQDLRTAYDAASIAKPHPKTQPDPNPNQGWRDTAFAVNAPRTPKLIKPGPSRSTVSATRSSASTRADIKPDNVNIPRKQAQRVNPKTFAESDRYIDRGDEYMLSSKWNEAIAAYKQAIAFAPNNADAFYSLGWAYNQMGRHGEAFAPLVKAIQLDSQYAEAHFGIGYAYLHSDNYSKAIPFFRTAIKLDPANPEAYYCLGQAYLGLGDKKGATEEYEILKGLMRRWPRTSLVRLRSETRETRQS